MQIEHNCCTGFTVVHPFHEILDSSQEHTQPAIICSKLTIETLEQRVKYVDKITNESW